MGGGDIVFGWRHGVCVIGPQWVEAAALCADRRRPVDTFQRGRRALRGDAAHSQALAVEVRRLLAADVHTGALYGEAELKRKYAALQPFSEWAQGIIRLEDLPHTASASWAMPDEQRERLCQAFGYAHEDLRDILLPMAETGSEPIVSMGADEPMAALSKVHPPLFDYFKQRFAQVTNPPIDAIREQMKTDCSIYIGDDGNLLDPCADNCV